MSRDHHLKIEMCQGPPNINKVKQYEIVFSFKFSFFSSVYLVMEIKTV